MIRVVQQPCKRCGTPFTQPRLGGQPLLFCGLRCRNEEKRERQAHLARERYRALRTVGVPAAVAQRASCSKWRFDALMKEANGNHG